jgi:multidrug efflux pump subunit AcrB
LALNQVKIKKGNLLIPLAELASWSFVKSSNSIKHFNGMREIAIEGSNANPALPIQPVIAEIEDLIVPSIEQKFTDVRVERSGQSKSQDKFTSSSVPVIIVVTLLIYFIIGLTFHSWLQPVLIILMVIPAIIGAAIGHYIENTFLVIMSYLGGIALIGIIVNDAIVFTDKFNRNLQAGMAFTDSIVDAGTSRFRPIILTSITTMAGLYPLIFESSNQAKFLIPMAITVTYGILFGTLVILFFFPALLACANDLRKVKYWIWNGIWPSDELVEPAVKELRRLTKEGYQLEEGQVPNTEKEV